MRKLVLAVILLLIAGPAFALDTGGANYDYLSGPTSNLFGHDHRYEQANINRDNPRGIGIDVIVYDNPEFDWLEEVAVESRFDLENDEQAVFVVGRINLFDIVKERI